MISRRFLTAFTRASQHDLGLLSMTERCMENRLLMILMSFKETLEGIVVALSLKRAQPSLTLEIAKPKEMAMNVLNRVCPVAFACNAIARD